MMGKTRIEWATDTWPIITGCSPVSDGCRNCYAARLAATRLKHHPHYKGLARMVNGHPQWTGKVKFNADVLEQPLHWRKPRVVFACSTGDLFHEGVSERQILDIWDVMKAAKQHVFLLLTKRPERMAALSRCLFEWPEHIWPGVTVETQEQIWRIDELTNIRAAKHFVSCEPLLGSIDLDRAVLVGAGGHNLPLKYIGLSGVIVGGESGPGARPMHLDWARSIRDQCLAAGMAYSFKQWGKFIPCGLWHSPFGFTKAYQFPDEQFMLGVGKKAAGRELDGKVWDEFPWKLLEETP